MITLSPEYNVSQPALYLICRILLDNCRDNRSTFAAKKAMYTSTWCDDIALQIEAASNLPDDQLRSFTHEQLRLQMVTKGNKCCELFQYAKSYIRTAFDDTSERQLNWNAAGLTLYEMASHQNWPSLDLLNKKCLKFITDNFVVLNKNGTNMPQTFVDEFMEAKDNWFALYLQFNFAIQGARTGRQSKVEANNALYRVIMDTICSDGQLYFRNNEELRRQFSFEAVAELVAPSGASTAVITVQNAETGQPLIAEVTSETTDRTIATTSDGQCEFGNLSAGTQIFTVIVDGYQPQPVSIDLKTGTISRLTVQMVPLFVSVSAKPVAPKPEMAIVSSNGQTPADPTALN